MEGRDDPRHGVRQQEGEDERGGRDDGEARGGRVVPRARQRERDEAERVQCDGGGRQPDDACDAAARQAFADALVALAPPALMDPVTGALIGRALRAREARLASLAAGPDGPARALEEVEAGLLRSFRADLDARLEAAAHHVALEDLDDVGGAHVVVVLEGHAALLAGGHLARVVLEALEL